MTITTNEPRQTTLYYREGSSDKVYHISLEPNGSPEHFLVRFAFGRRGSTLQTGTKTVAPVDYDTALQTFNQLVASKLAKGYTLGENGTPYQHTSHEGRSTGIYPQLLEAVSDTYALGRLLVDPLYCAQEKLDGKRSAHPQARRHRRGHQPQRARRLRAGHHRQGGVEPARRLFARWRGRGRHPARLRCAGEAAASTIVGCPYIYRLEILLAGLIPATCTAHVAGVHRPCRPREDQPVRSAAPAVQGGHRAQEPDGRLPTGQNVRI